MNKLKDSAKRKLVAHQKIDLSFDLDFAKYFDELYVDADLLRVYSEYNLKFAKLLNNMVFGIVSEDSFCDLLKCIDDLEDYIDEGLYGVRGSLENLMKLYDMVLGDCYGEM